MTAADIAQANTLGEIQIIKDKIWADERGNEFLRLIKLALARQQEIINEVHSRKPRVRN